jgi:hypothetical protein
MITGRTEIIQIRLADGTIINVEAENLGGQQYIAAGLPPAFDEISTTIEGIANSVVKTLRKIGPSKGSVEFGLQIAVEAGHLTTLLVKGSGAASLKITLEWVKELTTES